MPINITYKEEKLFEHLQHECKWRVLNNNSEGDEDTYNCVSGGSCCQSECTPFIFSLKIVNIFK